MAKVFFVTPTGAAELPAPSGLGMLPLDTRRRALADLAQAESVDAEIVLVDGRGDLAAARNACRWIRSVTSHQPVLLLVPLDALSALSTDWQLDDFILESAAPAEFDARLRLLAEDARATSLISQGPVQIDEDAYTATAGGTALDLTYTEFELLKFLIQHPGRVLTRDQLLSAVWGYDYFGGSRTVDVHIRRLRAKLGPEFDHLIGTVRNVGYRFQVN